MKYKKGDMLLIGAVLFVALLLLGIKALPSSPGDKILRVELDGQIIDEIPYDEETDQVINVEMPAGHATVEIAAGQVRVLPMPREICPLGICSSIGWVEQSGDAIVCLPNKLVLTVIGGQTNELWDSLDGVTK